MTERPAVREPFTGGRVLVLLDASRASLAALEAAVNLAAGRRQEVHAVFVEETSLLRSAGFAFAREIGAVSGTSRPLDRAIVQSRLRRQAERVRRAVERTATGHGVHHSLSVRRGSVLTEILALAGSDDLLVLGKVGWSATPGRTLGSTARVLAREASGPVLLWTMAPPRRDGAVLVLVDDFEVSRAALATALGLARYRARPLTILLVGLADPRASKVRDRAVADWLTGVDTEVRTHHLRSLEPRDIARVLREERGIELVLSRRSRLMDDQLFDAFLESLSLPTTVSP